MKLQTVLLVIFFNCFTMAEYKSPNSSQYNHSIYKKKPSMEELMSLRRRENQSFSLYHSFQLKHYNATSSMYNNYQSPQIQQTPSPRFSYEEKTNNRIPLFSSSKQILFFLLLLVFSLSGFIFTIIISYKKKNHY